MWDEPLSPAVRIDWSAQRRLLGAQGPCERVLGRPAQELVGLSLHQARGISEKQAAQLHERTRGSPGPWVEFVDSALAEGKTLRMALLPTDGTTAASILDLTELLRGAPPLQLAGLSSSLCHEIRNPLSSVKMAVQTVAKNTGLSERDKRRLAIANREIRTIERMLWLFSEYGREVNFPLELMPLKSVVLEAAALIQLELHERKIELDVQDSTKGCRVRTDPRRLRPVLAQLLLNIAQGLDEGAPLRVELARTDGACELTVEDAAVALPPEEQPTLFEPFGSRLARGAGLSLASLRRVMEDAGGSVRARGGASPPTIFVLHFPS